MKRDLLLLTADRNALYTLRGLLARTDALGIRSITLEQGDSFSHPTHDPGVVLGASDFLRPYLRTHEHALVCFDYEGCGKIDEPQKLEARIEQDLARNGWGNRVAVIAFEPELERWIWNGSNTLAKYFGRQNYTAMRDDLASRGFTFDSSGKPNRPKEAFEQSLRNARLPRSSAVYGDLVRELSFRRCTERSFVKLKQTLVAWFPPKI